MRSERPLTALSTALVGVPAALVLLFGAAPGAFAHSDLVSSDPEDGARVEQMPASVTLTFNEDIDPNFARIVVADEQDIARPVTAQVDGPRVTLPVPTEVPAGEVVVRYRVVSADAHPVGGEIAFTVAGGDATSAAPADPADPAAPTTAAPTSEDTTPTSVDDEGSTVWMYALAGVAALLVIGAGAAIALMGRRRR